MAERRNARRSSRFRSARQRFCGDDSQTGGLPALAVSLSSGPKIRPNSQPIPAANTSVLEEVVAEQARTIARLVGLLEKATANAPAALPPASRLPDVSPSAPAKPEVQSLPRANAGDGYEVKSTVPQRGIFASSRLSERLSASYNESITMRFVGTISVEKMTRAMERLVERHDALRTSFDETGAVMKVNPAQKIAMPVTDLFVTEASSMKESLTQQERLRKMIADETLLPFVLPDGPLFRCQMVVLGPNRAAVISHGAPHYLRWLVAGCSDSLSLCFLFGGNLRRTRQAGAGAELSRLRAECHRTRSLG